jgi:uncharacterized membrane protein
VREFTHEAVHELTHLDGKIFQTVRLLLFKPGALTLEWIRGRRARYVNPLRLYLICSLLFFAVASLAPQTTITVTEQDRKEAGEEALKRSQEAMRDVGERFVHLMPRGMFVVMPAFGLLTWLFYRKAQPYYVPHLYYSLHVHSFAFVVFAIAAACSFAGPYGDAVGKTIKLVLFPYYYIALRRVFGGTRGQTAWKGTLIGILYAVVLMGVLLLLIMLVLRTIRPSLHVS